MLIDRMRFFSSLGDCFLPIPFLQSPLFIINAFINTVLIFLMKEFKKHLLEI